MIRLFFIFSLFVQAAFAVDFVLFTQPKTGMHLMVPLLEELTGKKGVWPKEFIEPDIDCDEETYARLSVDQDYAAYHWRKQPVKMENFRHALHKAKWKRQFLYCNTPYSENMEQLMRAKKTKVITVLRDPRDIVVSAWQHYLQFEGGVVEETWLSDLPAEEQLTYFLEGTDWHNSARRLFSIFSKWQKSSVSCTVNFTKLLGLYGGGASQEEQVEELRKLSLCLGIEKSDRELLRAFDRAYGVGYTFQKTRVGAWKEVFSSEHLEIIERELRDLIEKYGVDDEGCRN